MTRPYTTSRAQHRRKRANQRETTCPHCGEPLKRRLRRMGWDFCSQECFDALLSKWRDVKQMQPDSFDCC